MTQHTPGPWRVDYDHRLDGADQVVDASGRTVAFIATPKNDHETDARLIAAAPQMLEALREMVADIARISVVAMAVDTNKARAVLATIDKEE